MKLEAPQLARPKILVVEDEPDIRTFLHLFLSRNGFDVETAETGLAALASFATRIPDLILLDMAMPDLDGMTFLDRRGQIEQIRKIPVMVLSARGRPAEVAAAIKAGATTYITKPFENARLLAGVSQLTRTTHCAADANTRVAW